MYRIVIGEKAYSSWSLRGWLLLAGFGLAFEEVPVRMYHVDFEAMKAERAPARTVPILEWQEQGRTRRVWESIAIAETLAERHPDAGHWPQDPHHRAVARVLAAEMHAGFGALRGSCPMNLHRDPGPPRRAEEGLDADLDALARLWSWALAETGGPWLAGPRFSAADAFYAPVAFRLRHYALDRPGFGAMAGRLLGHPAVERWASDARADPRRIAYYADF